MPNRQVNAPLRRSNDLPYRFSRPPILTRTQALLRGTNRLDWVRLFLLDSPLSHQSPEPNGTCLLHIACLEET